MLLPNIVFQFFFASNPRERRQHDPEKGPSTEAHDGVTIDVAEEGGTSDNSKPNPAFTPAETLPEDDGEEFPTTDEENDDNIIHELEQEEYPREDAPPTATRRRHLSTSRSLEPLTNSASSRISYWWVKIKRILDPRTSPSDLESYVPHYRYLPIVAGVVIPFSILLEIPGLTEEWYIQTKADKIVDKKPNTVILDVALAFSVAFAVMANVCLVVRFMEKKVKYMTVLCVIFLTIHDVINIICVTIFGVEHRFNDGFTYGQAFWMTVCSTSVSTLTNLTLIVDLIQTPDFATSGSGLTRKQRTLVISVIVLMTYLGFGALIQTFLLNLSFLNALYFTVVSIETIGFGDIVPNTAGARVFTCLYSVFGVLNLALTVGLTRETVLEGLEVSYRKRVRSVRLRRRAAQWEKRVGERWRAALDWRLREAGQPVWVMDDPSAGTRSVIMQSFEKVWRRPSGHGKYFRYNHLFGSGDHSHPHGMHLNLGGLDVLQLEAAAMEVGVPLRTLLPPGFEPKHSRGGKERISDGGQVGESGPRSVPSNFDDIPLTHARIGRMAVMLGNFAFAVNKSSFAKFAQRASHTTAPINGDVGEEKRQNSITEHYESARASMESEEKRAFYARLLVVWMIFILFWIVGSAIFMATEKWSFGIAFYFCFISFTTIGYGDFTPTTPAGRSVFVFWALLGVATMTILISILSEAYSNRYKRVFQSGAFYQGVKHYRERARRLPKQHVPVLNPPSSPQPDSPEAFKIPLSASTIDDALSDSRKRVEGQLEALPHRVLDQAKTFNENVRYLIEPEAADITKESVPDGLQSLLKNVAGVERLGEQIKQEILGDTDARHTLLAISVEDALRQIIGIAEEALDSLKERDRLKGLAARREQIEGTNLHE
ncbi:hypothetical protein BDZ94DRAFT_1174632 [Collybia nuda]|uniref:Potassium channel domain-containing protein n=1 Tax=Collybia nuda TaxID=64659 RepID=A0A9P6CDA3_9AGAR|nr:hypothetical protein BDZ94DRAFT_1174632 [Collybia nuda]